MSASYGSEKLRHLIHGMRRFVLTESVREAETIQYLTDELITAMRNINIIGDQLYQHVKLTAEEDIDGTGGATTTWRYHKDEAGDLWTWFAN
ncbi:hypothetical protein GIB67_042616 [Kingdonia uniflora]|uniref:Uncharacterized protein n=1 Tax=Kingdonia uniflora TaxID=39325 RepID=A0A7J7M1C7_9MAGN|nr:hypothetical protein GIB67_042616 [Kingdonia uniflora]